MCFLCSSSPAKLDEKRRWENPATYLEEDPQGPFYLLHNFRATAPLDSNDLKPVKMAGILRHKVDSHHVLVSLTRCSSSIACTVLRERLVSETVSLFLCACARTKSSL